ncbi:MAG: hypothetical protein KBT01_04700 [Clostridiales bacterium]|nr:hypothetical protein [Candidatus Blautia equi]
MAKRCQLCDGVIKNGRCPDCGMYYRSDDEMYHLNETRKDHMIHASSRVKKLMEENNIPLPDRFKGNEDVENPEAEQKLSSILKQKSQHAASSQIQRTKNVYKNISGMENKEKNVMKRRAALLIAVVIILLELVASGATFFARRMAEKQAGGNGYDPEWEIAYDSGLTYKTFEEALETSPEGEVLESFYVFDDEVQKLKDLNYCLGALHLKDGEGSLKPGFYMACCDNGAAALQISGVHGYSTFRMDQEDRNVLFELVDGDTIQIIEATTENTPVMIYSVKTY